MVDATSRWKTRGTRIGLADAAASRPWASARGEVRQQMRGSKPSQIDILQPLRFQRGMKHPGPLGPVLGAQFSTVPGPPVVTLVTLDTWARPATRSSAAATEQRHSGDRHGVGAAGQSAAPGLRPALARAAGATGRHRRVPPPARAPRPGAARCASGAQGGVVGARSFCAARPENVAARRARTAPEPAGSRTGGPSQLRCPFWRCWPTSATLAAGRAGTWPGRRRGRASVGKLSILR